MEDNGYKVESANVEDLTGVKRRYGIPAPLESCHTAIIGDYIVEGHIPVQVVERLLTERPDIDGIALPDMPSGSPGMPGPKNQAWTVYAFKKGQATAKFETL
jgi:hypothetical protein